MESRFSQLAINRLGGAWAALVEMIWPRFCVRCGREGEIFCAGCREAYRPRIAWAACPFCGRLGSNRTCPGCAPQTYLDGVLCLAVYGDPVVRETIRLWKYHGDKQAQELVDLWLKQLSGSWPDWIQTEVISYVPLHVSKRRTRGFDQAEEIAQQVGQITNRPVRPVLMRKKRTKAQAQQAKELRRVGDLDQIFQVEGPVPESVLLCDDVFTSGATMDAAARELKENGAWEVYGLCLARGSRKT